MLNSREISTQILSKIYNDCDLEDAINSSQSFLKLGSRDRAFTRLILLNTLRRHGEIDNVIGMFLKKPLKKKDYFIQNLLRISVAQILFLDTPEYSAVNSAVEISKKSGFDKLVNGVLRNICRKKKSLIKNLNPNTNLPEWIKRDIKKNFGEKILSKISQKIVEEPYIDIKIKSSSYGSKDWAKILNGKIIFPEIIRTKSQGPIPSLPFFNDGLWWVQGLASIFPVIIINEIYKDSNKNSVAVLDVGAAPGGKTFQLIESGYDITSLEISSKRIKKLNENLRRLNLRTKIICEDLKKLNSTNLYDCILIDAPCTGSGLIQKKPEILLRDKSENLKQLVDRQKSLLSKSTQLLKVGGHIIYCVCSIHSEEGVGQIRSFIKEFKNFSLVNFYPKISKFGDFCDNGMFISTPNDFSSGGGIDGFFIACLKKIDKQ